MERSEKEGGRKNWHAAEPRPQCRGIRMAHSEGGEAECRSLELLAESESERSHYNVTPTPTPAMRCQRRAVRVRRLSTSTKAKINPTVDGVLMAKRGRRTPHSCQSFRPSL